jgi:hypothetical protein
MPVNMNPKKRGKLQEPAKADQQPAEPEEPKASTPASKSLDEPTEADLAQKEWQHLWEQTEVIDMDKW